MTTAIQINDVSKLYRLGTVGTGTIAHDLNRWWHRIRGRDDPYAKVGQVNDRASKDKPSGDKAPDYVWALKEINLEVEQGDIVGIIGRNGAGKSTLLKLLSRVTAPTTGSIKTRGRIASLLEVGTGFHGELTGRENIYLNGSILGMKRHEITRELDQIVEFSGCAKYLDTPVKRFSSGMLVRLGFAVAAHLTSEVLIVDEVLAVGDVEFQTKCVGKMQELSESGGRTVLFVSHNMASIERLCKSAVLLESGGVTLKASVGECVDRYLAANFSLSSQNSLESDDERSGSGIARVRKVQLADSLGMPVAAIRSGDPMQLRFSVENLSNQPIGNCSLGYSITTSRGVGLVVSYSDYARQQLTLAPGLNEITISTEGVPLANGTYRIGCRLLQNEFELDWPKYSVLELVIDGGAYADNGANTHSGAGLVMIPATWSIA